MYCQKCGKQIDDDSMFYEYCGHAVNNQNNSNENSNLKELSSKTTDNVIEQNNLYTVAKKNKPNLARATIESILIILMFLGVCLGFWFLINRTAEVPIGLAIIFIGIAGYGGIKHVVECNRNSYDGKCPYCESDLTIYGEAANCPRCQKRIVVKDDKFYKV